MPNLMLTNYCNYRCPYCFGMDMMAPKVPAKVMSRETFTGILDWLDKDRGDGVIHLMGGEPTLHPEFEWVVEQCIERDYNVTIFSNLATDNAPILADKLSILPIHWVVNVNNPAKWTDKQRRNIESALAILGKNASITFNIMPDEDESWALELCDRFNLCYELKIGFILPTYSGSNMSLRDDQYAKVAEKTVALAKQVYERGGRLMYECGIPTCCFTDEQLGQLWRYKSKLHSGCRSRLDIAPDGEIFYCLPMAELGKRHYSTFENYKNATDWFERRYAPYRMLGRTEQCAECMLFNPRECNGACLAKNISSAKNVKFND